LENKIAHLKVYRFTPASVTTFELKLQQLTKNGASRVILDLRDCAGEEFEEGAKVANFFLDHGVIRYTQGQKSPKKEFVADPPRPVEVPLVVLQNYGSASAAEIVSAAIKENRRGDVVGVKSFRQSVSATVDSAGKRLGRASFHGEVLFTVGQGDSGPRHYSRC
jgi:carboxyl-terminal processing protease